MLSRSILNKRPPSSPNNPPHAPAKMTPKGQPVPLNMNFMLHGSHIEQSHTEVAENRIKSDKTLKFGVFNTENKIRPHTAHVDKRLLQSMTRSPSVDSSFYDKFERLDRDTIIGDTAYKEKGVSGKVKRSVSKQRPNSGRVRPSSAKERKRTKSATSTTRKPRLETSIGSFFETAMSFDNETKQNTLNNAVRQISPRTVLGRDSSKLTKETFEHRRRPQSGRKPRERSPSCKRSDRSNSISSRSVGSASLCSSRTGRSDRRNQQRKERSRKSRSRTRRVTPRPKCSDRGNSSQKSSSERNVSSIRSLSSVSRRKANSADIRQRFVVKTINALPNNELVTAPVKKDTGNFAYSYKHEKRYETKRSPVKNSPIKHAPVVVGNDAIAAVRKANEMQDQLNKMHEIDRLILVDRRPMSSTLPKLKMIVAPTATPLASLIRTSSAKMLMNHHYDCKRTF